MVVRYGDFMKNIDCTAMSNMQDMASISADMLYHASRGIKSSNPNGIVVMGEITSKATVDIEKVARQTIIDIGYNDDKLIICVNTIY